MSFEVVGNTARLEFGAGTVLEGATVVVSLNMAVRDFLRIQRLAAAAATPDTAQLETTLEGIEEAYQLFGSAALVRWDLTRDGEPIPADGTGMLSLPAAAANAIFDAWGRAVSSVPGNSSAASDNGAWSGAAFAKMEAR